MPAAFHGDLDGRFRRRGLRLPSAPLLALAATALFAFAWAVARAHVQSITIDEAATYLLFVARGGWKFALWPGANNHVLNTLSMRLLTSAFGPSHLMVRGGALLGAAAYISAAYLL